MEVLLIIIGWLIIQIYDIKRGITKSKGGFNPVFFFKDTRLKIITALIFSFSIGAGFYFTVETGEVVYQWGNIKFDIINLIYIGIGAVPEFILQQFRKKLGILKTK